MNEIRLKYIGQGFLVGVPARDLSEEEVWARVAAFLPSPAAPPPAPAAALEPARGSPGPSR